MDPATLSKGFESIRTSLSDLGYQNVTVERIAAIYKRWQRGEKTADQIDQFAFDEFERFPNIFGKAAA